MLFRNYKYFMAVVEHQSVTKAAEKLFISQSSLSKYISRLEKSLDIELFDRTTSPLKLSYAGERYLEYVRQVMQLERKLTREFDEIKAYERSKVVIGIALWRGSCLLPDILPSFQQEHPHIQIDIREGRGDILESLISKNITDFCIMNTPISYRDMHYEVILTERILLAVHKDNPLLQTVGYTRIGISDVHHIDLNAIQSQMLLQLKQGQHLAATVQNLLNKYNLRFENYFETENLQTAINMVSRGIGVTFVPETGIRNKPIENVLFFTVDDPPLTTQLAAVYKDHVPLSWSARLLLDHIKQYYSD